MWIEIMISQTWPDTEIYETLWIIFNLGVYGWLTYIML